MAIIDKKVLVKWSKAYKKYYENKGYIFTKIGDVFEIDVTELPKLSTINVMVMCDVCKKVHKIRYASYIRNCVDNEYRCSNCMEDSDCIDESIPKPKEHIKIINNDERDKLNEIKKQKILNCIVNDKDKERCFPYSGEIIEAVCPDCGYIKKYRMRDLWNNGFSCPRCGDGFSYPNKFAFNFFEQLDVSFIAEYVPTWSYGKRFDFYFKLNNKKYIVEMDGWFHFNDNPMSGTTKEEAHEIDDEKDKLAAENDVHMIRIDSCESTLEYIKENIYLSDLNDLFDLSKIDWNKCNEYASNSIVKIICDLWNQDYGVMNIIKKLQISNYTVNKYLHRGHEIGLCNYIPLLAQKVICINTKEVFINTCEAGKKTGILSARISANARGQAHTSGKNPITGEGYRWMFYDDYINIEPEKLKSIEEMIEKDILLQNKKAKSKIA